MSIPRLRILDEIDSLPIGHYYLKLLPTQLVICDFTAIKPEHFQYMRIASTHQWHVNGVCMSYKELEKLPDFQNTHDYIDHQIYAMEYWDTEDTHSSVCYEHIANYRVVFERGNIQESSGQALCSELGDAMRRCSLYNSDA